MAQVTTLTPLGTPGQISVFVAKTAAPTTTGPVPSIPVTAKSTDITVTAKSVNIPVTMTAGIITLTVP